MAANLPCDPEVAFRFADGRTARSLDELAEVAASSPGLAEHHRLHYHHWIRDVVRDDGLAHDVEGLAGADLGGDAYRLALVEALRRAQGSSRGRASSSSKGGSRGARKSPTRRR